MRRSAFVAMVATGLLLGSCSKTQDTAPETRLFGNPPVIQNAQLVQSSSIGRAECDITDMIKGYLCVGGLPLTEVDIQPLKLVVNYTEAQISVHATDPDTAPGGQNDILLVSASYLSSSTGSVPTETSLVVLDDGGTSGPNQFNFKQAGIELGEDCKPTDPSLCGDPSVACAPAEYKLQSNDAVANDDTFTRGFALIGGSGDFVMTQPANIATGTRSLLANDCIPKAKGQFPAISSVTPGTNVNFKIEVVDRAGNLTQWPVPLATTFQKTTFTCGPDECACCLLFSSNPSSDCRNRPGLVGPNYPNGLCPAIFP